MTTIYIDQNQKDMKQTHMQCLALGQGLKSIYYWHQQDQKDLFGHLLIAKPKVPEQINENII